MEKREIGEFGVSIPDWVVERWCVICYLIINWRIADVVKQVQVKPGKEFYEVTARYLYDYAVRDIMPPDEIAPAIMNLGEDFMSGKPVQFRPGDYITIQNYLRRGK